MLLINTTILMVNNIFCMKILSKFNSTHDYLWPIIAPFFASIFNRCLEMSCLYLVCITLFSWWSEMYGTRRCILGIKWCAILLAVFSTALFVNSLPLCYSEIWSMRFTGIIVTVSSFWHGSLHIAHVPLSLWHAILPKEIYSTTISCKSLFLDSQPS